MKSKQVVKIVDNIVSVVLILFVLVSGSIAIFFSYNRLQNNMVYVFGYSVCYVLTGSMEPSISKGDMILIKKVSDVSTIKKGDIITFKRTHIFTGQNVTHRVESVENGNQYYFHKGVPTVRETPNCVATRNFGRLSKKAPVLKFVVEGLSNPYILLRLLSHRCLLCLLYKLSTWLFVQQNQDK